mmetsp:Transcript_8669/g.15675  ORF Transcript_8669/g.15675 Transcript_8669/m.15675 type:complete len:300 (-) Transcript_8669:745-1644(-)
MQIQYSQRALRASTSCMRCFQPPLARQRTVLFGSNSFPKTQSQHVLRMTHSRHGCQLNPLLPDNFVLHKPIHTSLHTHANFQQRRSVSAVRSRQHPLHRLHFVARQLAVWHSLSDDAAAGCVECGVASCAVAQQKRQPKRSFQVARTGCALEVVLCAVEVGHHAVSCFVESRQPVVRVTVSQLRALFEVVCGNVHCARDVFSALVNESQLKQRSRVVSASCAFPPFQRVLRVHLGSCSIPVAHSHIELSSRRSILGRLEPPRKSGRLVLLYNPPASARVPHPHHKLRPTVAALGRPFVP